MYKFEKQLDNKNNIVPSNKNDEKYYHSFERHINNEKIKSHSITESFIMSNDDEYSAHQIDHKTLIFSSKAELLTYVNEFDSDFLGIFHGNYYYYIYNNHLKRYSLKSIVCNSLILIKNMNINKISKINEDKIALHTIDKIYGFDTTTYDMNIPDKPSCYDTTFFNGKDIAVGVRQNKCRDVYCSRDIYINDESIVDITFHPKEDWMIIRDKNFNKLIDIKTGKLLQQFGTCGNVKFSATGKYLYFCLNFSIQIYKYEDVEEMFGDMKNAAKTK